VPALLSLLNIVSLPPDGNEKVDLVLRDPAGTIRDAIDYKTIMTAD